MAKNMLSLIVMTEVTYVKKRTFVKISNFISAYSFK